MRGNSGVQTSRTLSAKLRSRGAAQFEHEFHHALFDIIPNLTVFGYS